LIGKQIVLLVEFVELVQLVEGDGNSKCWQALNTDWVSPIGWICFIGLKE
jgi:hypothetical protein